MASLLVKIIPLDLAAALSPGIFALTLVLLGSQFHPKIRTFSLFLGTLVVAAGLALAGLALGQATPSEVKATLLSAVIDFLLGGIFIFLGIKAVLAKERKVEPKEAPKPQIVKWILIGLVISVTNFDAVFLTLAAAKEVGGSNINEISKIILLLANILFFTLPTTLPLLFYLFLPNLAGRILGKVNHIVLKYSRYVVFVLLVIFGIYFIYRGLKFFI
jgi:putative Mn2+ efflux pump MntP